MSTSPPPPPHPAPPVAAWGTPWTPPLPAVPGSGAALVLGIVALAGGFILVLPLLAAPFAWYLGARATREIERQPQRWGGHGSARAGRLLGMIGTAGLALVGLVATCVALLSFVSLAMPSPY